jgi:hypothetical protein
MVNQDNVTGWFRYSPMKTALYGKKVILSGPAANDPEDYITDEPLGGQFIEIAEKLKKRYGARLVDLVPTARASNMLMDIWGWALKRDRGRKLVQERQGNALEADDPIIT